MTIKETRRYRAYLKTLSRNEFIEKKEDEIKTDSKVEVECDYAVELPNYLGKHIDLYI